jgi:hypothetical protein
MKLRRMPFWVMVAGAMSLLSQPALAWDPATTHAGLTERALAGSNFHATLAHQLGRALGSLEPLHLDLGALAPNTGRSLKSRLDALDPAGGYRPSAEGVATASAWVRAGAVLAKTPPERGRHHFFEPRTRKGLDDGPGLSGAVHVARLTFDDGATVRDSATGQSFDLQGMPALDWLHSPQNDLGLMAFLDQWVLAVSAPQASQRETALAQALLALGGTLAVLEDAGQPAFVRNDFRGEFLARDSGSALERFVSDRYGSASLPPAPASVSRPDLDSYFVAADGNGLAQLTQGRFFSAGTLPEDIRFVSGQKQSEIVDLVNRSLRFPEPKVTSLDLRQTGRTHYVVREGIRVLAYQRNADRVHFFLDQAVHADMARSLLPQVEAYAAGLVDHLLRAKLTIVVADNKAQVTVTGAAIQAGPTFAAHLFAEDDAGVRTEIASQTLHGDASSLIEIPKGARRVAAYLRGQDSAGAFVAAAEARVP